MPSFFKFNKDKKGVGRLKSSSMGAIHHDYSSMPNEEDTGYYSSGKHNPATAAPTTSGAIETFNERPVDVFSVEAGK